LRETKVTRAGVGELQKALPNCQISHNLKLSSEESAKVIETAIRNQTLKPPGELTKADLEKVTQLDLRNIQISDVSALKELKQLTVLVLVGNQISDVSALKELKQLKELYLQNNPDLTKAQIDELQKALPKCRIDSNPKK